MDKLDKVQCYVCRKEVNFVDAVDTGTELFQGRYVCKRCLDEVAALAQSAVLEE